MIFNSLGSNYSLAFHNKVNHTLLNPRAWNDTAPELQLVDILSKAHQGKTKLFYKGRHAISAAIKSLGLKSGDQVLTQAFTCYAVESGITTGGAAPLYTDTEVDSLNLSVRTLESALSKASCPKAVLVQHTLGSPAPIEAIAKFCRQHHLYLIEDLAHSYGLLDDSGLPLGHYADAIILSFGRDKVIDAVSGGALIVKNLVSDFPPTTKPSSKSILLDLTYPSRVALLRRTSSNPFGKLTHRLFKKTGLLSNPISDSSNALLSLPPSLAKLVLFQLQSQNKTSAHRRQISSIYTKNLKSNSSLKLFPGNHAYLRFPLLVPNRLDLLNYLKKHHFFLQDTWYSHPVETGSLKHLTSSYQVGSCPQAEYLSAQIINLPTHINISIKQAEHLSKLINLYYQKSTS